MLTDSRESIRAVESAPQPLAAELVGTFALVFFGVGSAVLAAEYIGTFGIALAFGFTLLALIYALGPISGSHVNPAVTLGMLLAGRIDNRTAVSYWLAQLVGAIAGSALLFLVARQVPGVHVHENFGSNGYDDRSAVDISIGGALIAEVMMTCLLVFVWLSVTHELAVTGFDGLPIGLALAAVHLIGVPLTGTSVNPARSIGPALFAAGDALAQLWLFILAPLIGAALAVVVHRLVHPQAAPPGPARPAEAEAPPSP
jgi:aquaporin Z